MVLSFYVLPCLTLLCCECVSVSVCCFVCCLCVIVVVLCFFLFEVLVLCMCLFEGVFD